MAYLTTKDIIKEWADREFQEIPTTNRVRYHRAMGLYLSLVDTIMSHIKQGDEITLEYFGKFELRDRAANRSNLTGQIIPAHKILWYIPPRDIKEAVKNL